MSKDLAILIAAAGRGHRAGEGIPKQYRNLAGQPLLARTLACFVRAWPGSVVLPIVHKNDLKFFQACLGEIETELARRLAAPVFGGATRQESVRTGLEALSNRPAPPEIVLIHDAARPFVGGALIERAIRSAKD